MLHLALKAFAPAPMPFSLLHVDTGHNFPEVLEYRDRTVAEARAAPACRLRAGLHRPRCSCASAPTAPATRSRRVPLTEKIQSEKLRRRLRRRTPRRGEGPRQGAGVLPARRVLAVGPAPPAPRAVAALQRPPRARRARPRLPALQLDRAGRLAVHRPRGHRAARDLLRPRARGVRALRHVADRRRVGRPEGRRDRREAQVRYRTVGDMSCTGAVDSDATTLEPSSPRSPPPGSPSGAPPAPTTRCPRPRWKTASARGTSKHEHRSRPRSSRPPPCCGSPPPGSVDDGKSTLVGRLLHDSKSVLTDQLEAVERASANRGQEAPDLALLTDGLRAEREQGITIDVAYRYFATPAPPVHPRRHPRATCSTPATWSPAPPRPSWRWSWSTPATASSSRPAGTPRSPRCCASRTWCSPSTRWTWSTTRSPCSPRSPRSSRRTPLELGVPEITAIPISALAGDNVVDPSANMDWYGGPTVLEHLETVPVSPRPEPTATRAFPCST